MAEVFRVLLGMADPVPKKITLGYFRSLIGTDSATDVFIDSMATGNPGTARVSSTYSLRFKRGTYSETSLLLGRR